LAIFVGEKMEKNSANSRKHVNKNKLPTIWNHKFQRKMVTPNE
jgi:hypothetical protein